MLDNSTASRVLSVVYATKAITKIIYDRVLSVVYATKAITKITTIVSCRWSTHKGDYQDHLSHCVGSIAASRSVAKDAPLRRTVQRTGTIVATQTGASRPSCCESASNLGDVIIENDVLYGDGVNIAARLEPLAEPAGICVSSIVHRASAIGSTLASGMAVT